MVDPRKQWKTLGKIKFFGKNAHLPENVHEKTRFFMKKVLRKKIRKGSEASETLLLYPSDAENALLLSEVVIF